MKTNVEIAREVIGGLWGNGKERRERLTNAGYNYEDIQGIVNALLNDTYVEPQPDEEISDEPVFEIKGTEIMEIDVNLNQYNGIKLKFKVE